MKKREKEKLGNGSSVPLPSYSDLRGRQSVRATFRLTQRAIDTLSAVAMHLGIKQKSLFDHLIDDVESLHLVASAIRSERFDQLERVQKTYVLSRKTLSCLGEVSRRFDAPRDALVEYSIERLMPIVAEEQKRHGKRKQILREIGQYVKEGEKLLQRSSALLGHDDPVSEHFENAIRACRNVHASIQYIVERGDMIEDF
ncbi:MAG: hypothetical protein SWE60_03360 [Thermodesulfobacteriota bacterium]|nr:hypothetical protein [Thermodesulfobacteriota bacterium]